MKRLVLILMVICLAAALPATVFSDDSKKKGWESEFIEALQQGKMPIMGEGGLPYTPSEETVLEGAIQGAMQEEAPPCQVLTLAVEMEYNPYMVMKNIYSFEGEVDLDQLCLCATQKGISKQVIAKAAMDAQRNGEPVFTLDEVTQSNCLQSDEGLAYTLADEPPDVIPPPPNPTPQSRSIP